jgi:hypothetical protein
VRRGAKTFSCAIGGHLSRSSKPLVPSTVLQLFATLPDPVQELAHSARRLVLATVPDAIEIPDAKAKLIGYGYGAGYKDMVATLILSKTGIKIGLVQGASLPDPASLLKGAGRVHRYIDVRTAEQLRRPEAQQLIAGALSAWRRRSQPADARKPRK